MRRRHLPRGDVADCSLVLRSHKFCGSQRNLGSVAVVVSASTQRRAGDCRAHLPATPLCPPPRASPVTVTPSQLRPVTVRCRLLASQHRRHCHSSSSSNSSDAVRFHANRFVNAMLCVIGLVVPNVRSENLKKKTALKRVFLTK